MISVSLLNSSFIACMAFLFHSALWVFLEFIQVFIRAFVNFIDHFYNHSFEFFGIYPLYDHFCSFGWSCWLLEESCCLIFSYFLCFCFGVCASAEKSLIRSFSWSSFKVQEELCSDKIEVLFLTTGLRVTCARRTGCKPQHSSYQGKLAGVSCISINSPLLGCFH
jgi:hypothetical protein